MPARFPPRPTNPARRTAVLACVALAALAHAAVLGVAGQAWAPELPAAAAPKAPLMRARVVVFSPLPAAPPEVTMTAARARPATARAVAPAADTTAPRAVAVQAVADRSAPTAPAGAAPQPLRLYAFDEVDRPAAPEDGWALDIATLDAAGLARLAFELVVDAAGQVLACTVIDPIGLDDAVRTDLERRLAATPLRPAERGGFAVASVRRIELRVEPAD